MTNTFFVIKINESLKAAVLLIKLHQINSLYLKVQIVIHTYKLSCDFLSRTRNSIPISKWKE